MRRTDLTGRVGSTYHTGRHRIGLAILAFAAIVLLGDAVRSAILSPTSSDDSRQAPAARNQAADERVARIRAWSDAIYQHRPGEVDKPVFVLLQYRSDELVSMLDDVGALLNRLEAVYVRGRRPDDTFFVSFAGGSFKVRDVESALNLPEDEVARRDLTRFVKRAAILQMDTAMLIDTEGVAFQSRAAASDRSALIVAKDGQNEGRVLVNQHWVFGRRLLERVQPDPTRDEMVKLWYYAAASLMLNRSAFGDLAIHLGTAQTLFRNDARLHFYSGAMHESFSGERVQSVAREFVVSRDTRPQVENADAERKLAAAFFERALELDPNLVEARLRLGRVRGLQGRHEEAASLLKLALAATSDTLLHYYGQLFLGREEAALGHHDEARAAFERAAVLSPRAQSPRLALSQMARAGGDRAGAIKPLRELLRQPATTETDPWWAYDTAAGRHLKDLLTELRKPFLAGGRQ